MPSGGRVPLNTRPGIPTTSGSLQFQVPVMHDCFCYLISYSCRQPENKSRPNRHIIILGESSQSFRPSDVLGMLVHRKDCPHLSRDILNAQIWAEIDGCRVVVCGSSEAHSPLQSECERDVLRRSGVKHHQEQMVRHKSILYPDGSELHLPRGRGIDHDSLPILGGYGPSKSEYVVDGIIPNSHSKTGVRARCGHITPSAASCCLGLKYPLGFLHLVMRVSTTSGFQ